MIQRIQSLYLFIGAVLLSACLFMPLWKATSVPHANKNIIIPETTFILTAFGLNAHTPPDIITNVENTLYIGGGLVITILLSLYIIMQFKNRTLQIRLSLLNTFLIFIVIGLMYWKCSQLTGTIPANEKHKADFTIAFFFPALAAMLNLFAMRSIKKDEELVRSADRMR